MNSPQNQSNFVSRVNQLDAEHLNRDIGKIFRNSILDAVQILSVAYRIPADISQINLFTFSSQ